MQKDFDLNCFESPFKKKKVCSITFKNKNTEHYSPKRIIKKLSIKHVSSEIINNSKKKSNSYYEFEKRLKVLINDRQVKKVFKGYL